MNCVQEQLKMLIKCTYEVWKGEKCDNLQFEPRLFEKIEQSVFQELFSDFVFLPKRYRLAKTDL